MLFNVFRWVVLSKTWLHTEIPMCAYALFIMKISGFVYAAYIHITFIHGEKERWKGTLLTLKRELLTLQGRNAKILSKQYPPKLIQSIQFAKNKSIFRQYLHYSLEIPCALLQIDMKTTKIWRENIRKQLYSHLNQNKLLRRLGNNDCRCRYSNTIQRHTNIERFVR